MAMAANAESMPVPSRLTGYDGVPSAISIQDLSFCFPDRSSPALRGVSLEIAERECVAITGPSGCGKSTLALAMAGYIPHVITGTMSGQVNVFGTDTQEAALCDLAVTVSLCQQDPESQLCTLSVEDEVRFGPENLALPVAEILRRQEEALAAIGSLHLKGRDVFKLSGGEKQRVAISSMLAMQPRVLILDEPTSNLDPDAAHEVLLAIERLRQSKKMTLIIIEHRLDRLLPLVDRLIVMAAGKIWLDGESDDVYKEYVGQLQDECSVSVEPFLPDVELSTADPVAFRVRELRFKHGVTEVLCGISLTAMRGELIGIIGANGSGKTTFLGCLAGLNQPASGEVVICGANTKEVKPSAIARKVGFVFQNPNHQIFETTVKDEVTFASKNFGMDPQITEARAYKVLSEFGLTSYDRFHPLQLSHGEKRRLNMCSILPHGPGIIILDEPFIGQDHGKAGLMMAAVLGLKNRGYTTLLVSHDIDMVFRYCTRIVLFDAGRILADDIPARVYRQIQELGKLNFLPAEP